MRRKRGYPWPPKRTALLRTGNCGYVRDTPEARRYMRYRESILELCNFIARLTAFLTGLGQALASVDWQSLILELEKAKNGDTGASAGSAGDSD